MKPRDHRLSVLISEDMYQRLQKHFPWGTQAEIVRRVLELTLDKMERDGYNTISLLLSGKYNPLEEFEKSLNKEKSL